MLSVSRLIVEEGEIQRLSDLSKWPARKRGAQAVWLQGSHSPPPPHTHSCRAGKGSQVRRTCAGNYWRSGPDFPLADLINRKIGRNWSAATSPQGPEKNGLRLWLAFWSKCASWKIWSLPGTAWSKVLLPHESHKPSWPSPDQCFSHASCGTRAEAHSPMKCAQLQVFIGFLARSQMVGLKWIPTFACSFTLLSLLTH